jgi:hypothetical protein
MQHYDTQYNGTQHNNIKEILSIVTLTYRFGECRGAYLASKMG